MRFSYPNIREYDLFSDRQFQFSTWSNLQIFFNITYMIIYRYGNEAGNLVDGRSSAKFELN